MTEYSAPGVYIEEVPFKSRPIEGVPTSNTAFIDIFEQGPIGKAVKIECFADFERVFGGLHARSEASYAIRQNYLNGGRVAWVVRVDSPRAKKLIGDPAAQTGMYALEGIAPDSFNILCIPAAANLDQKDFAAVISAAEKYCCDKRAFLIIDPPSAIKTADQMVRLMKTNDGLRHRNAAIYFPHSKFRILLMGISLETSARAVHSPASMREQIKLTAFGKRRPERRQTYAEPTYRSN